VSLPALGDLSVIHSDTLATGDALDLDPAAPYRFVREPAQFMLHHWRRREGVVSHVAFVDDHPAL